MSDTDLQKQTAARCNNAAWGLVETADLDAASAVELVTLAATARHHWHQIGTPGQKAHADLLLGWALARAGAGPAAQQLSQAALAHFDETTSADWERAFAHAACAAACLSAQDADGHARHYAEAKALGAGLSGPDATYFDAAFRTLPEPGGT